MAKVICTVCGNEFTAHGKRAKIAKFCSIKCRTTRKVIPCHHCGIDVVKHPFEIAKYTNVFCSGSCYAAFKSTGHINQKGYKIITHDGNLIGEHRVIMERHLGRKLHPREHVHHKNRDTLDNRIDNLEVLEISAHSAEHHPMTWDVEEAKKLYESGVTLTDIGKAMGVTRTAIALVFKRRGIHSPVPRTG